jgi:hypothetical protein
MKQLKAYVGIDNRFVMCEKFPDDEDHGGLNEMLMSWIDYDTHLSDVPLEPGFYLLTFTISSTEYFNPDRDMSDAYLELEKAEYLGPFGGLS